MQRNKSRNWFRLFWDSLRIYSNVKVIKGNKRVFLSYLLGRLFNRLQPTNELYLIRYKDLLFWARLNEIPSALLTWEQYELNKWFIPNIKDGIVIDVGANIGGYTVRACKYAEKIISIEPLPDVAKILERNVKLNCDQNKVIIINKAINNRKKRIQLYIPKEGTPLASFRKFSPEK